MTKVRTYHQLAIALGTAVHIKFMIELNIGWLLLSVVVTSVRIIIALREAHFLGAGNVAAGDVAA